MTECFCPRKPHFILIPFLPLHFHLFSLSFVSLFLILMSIHSPFHSSHRVLCASKAPSPPRTTHFFQSSYFVLFLVIVLMMIVVSGDDTQALRDTISSLCSLNSVGKFASCCVSYDNGANITLEYSADTTCFIASLGSTTGSVLTSLFVICFIFVLFLLFDDCHSFSSFFIFRDFESRGLGVLGKDVFSSLTNLQFFFFLLLTLSSIHFFLHSFPSF